MGVKATAKTLASLRKDLKHSVAGTGALKKLTKDEFLGDPRITSNKNAANLKPKELSTTSKAKAESFAIGDGLTAKYSKDGATVYDDGKPIASYNFGDTLVVDKAYRRQGVGEELVYQYRTRHPEASPAKERTKASQKLQEKVWERINRERDNSSNLLAGGAGAAVLGGALSPAEQAKASVGQSPFMGGFQADNATADVLGAVGSGMAAYPLAFGNAALGAVQGETPEQIEGRANTVYDALTMMPSTSEGQAALLGISDKLNELDKRYGIGHRYNVAVETLGDKFPIPSWRPQIKALLGEF